MPEISVGILGIGSHSLQALDEWYELLPDSLESRDASADADNAADLAPWPDVLCFLYQGSYWIIVSQAPVDVWYRRIANIHGREERRCS